MAEVLMSYGTRIRGPDERSYTVRACGRERDDGLWEGWLEYLPVEGGDTVVTPRETTQPNRNDLLYWATGLTDPYMDGALTRALRQPVTAAAPAAGPPPADGPASSDRTAETIASPTPAAILDPFRVHAEGADVLRGQLRALRPDHLRNIIAAYRLSDVAPMTLDRMDRSELEALIILAVEERGG
ncbi:MAG TPA: hypothetical protein VK936_15120 [Longimicrobiales bacterium]|nr:hypothetical protein [Longimicrobiales bacterium]